MKFVAPLALCAAVCAFSLPAQAQFAKPEDAIKYRKAALNVMAAHFGRVVAMANGRMPFDAKAAADNAAIAEEMSKLPFVAFVEGSDKGETGAKPEIWSNNAKFKAAAEKMQGEMVKLASTAKSGGGQDALRAQAGAVAGACKACHDDFRRM